MDHGPWTLSPKISTLNEPYSTVMPVFVLGMVTREDLVGCKVHLGSRVQGLGSRVQGLGSRVQGLGSRVQGLRSRVQGLGFRVCPWNGDVQKPGKV